MRGVLILAMLALAPLSAASAANVIVNVGGTGLAFSPQSITIDPGDTVTFINKGGYHNAVADDGSFRCARGCDGDGQGGNGNASNFNWIASRTFTAPGRIGYYCEPHGSPGQGMYGTITVRAPATPAPVPSSALRWLLLLAATLVFASIRALLKQRPTRTQQR
jgi:plastocyanin